jgi:hypothetical protein
MNISTFPPSTPNIIAGEHSKTPVIKPSAAVTFPAEI